VWEEEEERCQKLVSQIEKLDPEQTVNLAKVLLQDLV
jgi:hypothetical protein